MPGSTAVRAVAINPKQPEYVYAAGAGGVFPSQDAGQTWGPPGIGLGDAAVVALTLDPGQPDHLYAATMDGRLFASEDAGKSWRPLPG